MLYLKSNNILNRKALLTGIPRLCSTFYSTQATKQSTSKSSPKTIPNVVLIDAVRTPFAVSNTVYSKLMAVNLQRHALKGFLGIF